MLKMLMVLLLSILCATFCNAGYDYYRLPRSVRPQHYNLRILTHLDENELFFTGDVEIHLSILSCTENITLHAGSHLNIAQNGTRLHKHKPQCNESIEIQNMERNLKYDFLILHLETTLRQGQRYILRLPFWSKLGRSMFGYYASSYDDGDCKKKFLSVTQFEPAFARSAFPCFDEPAFKATFNISLGHHWQYNALSNMPLIDRIAICDRENWVWSIFKKTELMSTYLVAYSVNDFEAYPSKSKKYQLKFNTWARPSAKEQCKYASEIGPRLMTYYVDMFDIDYSLPKMDMIAVPDFHAGAMENWGLVTFRETALLYDDNASSELDKNHVASIVAHELAHQWFGNLVTMEWWNDLWLNEGFADYMATLVMDKLCSLWHTYEEESLDNVLTILNTDAYWNTRPIHQDVSHASQIWELFDVITYRKGAIVIRMMHMLIGDVAFRRGLNSYLIKHAFGNAKQQDLWDALTEAAHQCGSISKDVNVQTIMNTWTMQKGVPLVTVQRHYEKKSATVTQKRYLIQDDSLNQPTEDQSCWYIPISYATDCLSNFISAEPRTYLRCNKNHEPMPLELEGLPDEQEWVIFNVQVATPYRVNYDETNWELIIKALHGHDFKRIHVMNRAQLLDDSLAFARSGLMHYEMAMELLVYLKQEKDYMPWRAAMDQLTIVYRIVRQTKQYEEFQHFMLHLLEPIYCHLEGMHERSQKQQHLAHKALIAKWACRLSHADCVEHALKYFHHWFICETPDETNPVPRNLRFVVYCTAMRHGDEEDWNFLWHRYRNSTVASEQRQMLMALACTQKACLLERYLNLIYHEKSFIRKQDASHIFGAIVQNKKGFHIAKDFYLNKYKLLMNFYTNNVRELVGMFVRLAQQTSCAMGFRQLREYINGHPEVQHNSERSLRRAMEQVKLNLCWRQRQLPEFIRTLAKRNCD